MKKVLIFITVFILLFTLASCKDENTIVMDSKVLEYSFDETDGSMTKETVSNKSYKINYVFNEENKDVIFKAPSDPLLKKGVKGNALYMDGFSNKITNNDFGICIVMHNCNHCSHFFCNQQSFPFAERRAGNFYC